LVSEDVYKKFGDKEVLMSRVEQGKREGGKNMLQLPFHKPQINITTYPTHSWGFLFVG
jgi:hypothetical protein